MAGEGRRGRAAKLDEGADRGPKTGRRVKHDGAKPAPLHVHSPLSALDADDLSAFAQNERISCTVEIKRERIRLGIT